MEQQAGTPVAARAEATDEELLDAHVGGDPEAFAEIVRRHYPFLFRVARRTSYNEHDAAEALQEGLVSAYRRAHGFRGRGPVAGWLYRIVVNACLDKMRAQKLRTHTELTPLLHEQITARDVFQQDPAYAVIIAEALAELPDVQRDAVVLVDMLRFTFAEASHLLAASPNTLKTRCRRGRRRLADLLEGVRIST